MLRILRRGQRWIMAAVIVLVGGVFVFYLGVGGAPTAAPAGTVLELDGRRYGVRDVQRVRLRREQSLRESLGDAFDASAAGDQLDQLSLEELIQRGLLAIEAERLGLRVSEEEIRRAVRSIPGAVDDRGRLRTEALRSFAEVEYGTERRFADTLRDELLVDKLLRLVDAGIEVSEAEARDAVRHRLEEIRIAFVALEGGAATDAEITEQAVDRFLGESEAQARSFYEENPDRYHIPERVRARHILLRVEANASPEQTEEVRGRTAGVLARLQAGESFAEVAGEVSEDPGSRDRGGDLGYFARGQMVGAFEQVAFSLAPGELSDLVRTAFGFHILRVEERQPAQDFAFEQVRRAIAKELLAREAAQRAARATSERLADAIRTGRSLVDAAREEGVSIERSDWLKRRPDGRVPRLGLAPELLATAFALADDRTSSDRTFEVGEKLVLVQRLERRGPASEDVAEEVDTERQRLREDRRGRARSLWLETARQRLADQGRLRVDLSPLGGP